MPIYQLLTIISVVLFWVLFILFFLLVILRNAHEWSTWLWLMHSGSFAEGRVLSHKTRSGGKGGRFYVVYQFRPNIVSDVEPDLTQEQQVSWRHFEKLADGTPITIKFLPFAPQISRLAGDGVDNTVRDATTFWTVIVILFPPFLILWLVIFLLELYPKNFVAVHKHVIPRLFL